MAPNVTYGNQVYLDSDDASDALWIPDEDVEAAQPDTGREHQDALDAPNQVEAVEEQDAETGVGPRSRLSQGEDSSARGTLTGESNPAAELETVRQPEHRHPGINQ